MPPLSGTQLLSGGLRAGSPGAALGGRLSSPDLGISSRDLGRRPRPLAVELRKLLSDQPFGNARASGDCAPTQPLIEAQAADLAPLLLRSSLRGRPMRG